MDRACAFKFQFVDFTCDDLGSTISITDYPDTALGTVVIPWSIAGKPVTVIKANALNEVVGMTSVIIDLPTNSDPLSDANGDGVNYLMADALDLDPRKNLSGSLPQIVLEADQMSLSDYSGSLGITYRVEACTDLMNWTDVAVSLSLPNSFQIATAAVSRSGSQRFMRLVVEK